MKDFFFSLSLRTINQEEYPVVVLGDATCDICGREFQVRSPKDSEDLLNALVDHMLHRCPGSKVVGM